MWGLPTLIQINEKHAELSEQGPVDVRRVAEEVGIRLGDSIPTFPQPIVINHPDPAG